jgi:hypothetical protein
MSTVVAETYNCTIMLDKHGFYVTCNACPYVSPVTASKSAARRWANAHDENTGKEARA